MEQFLKKDINEFLNYLKISSTKINKGDVKIFICDEEQSPSALFLLKLYAPFSYLDLKNLALTITKNGKNFLPKLKKVKVKYQFINQEDPQKSVFSKEEFLNFYEEILLDIVNDKGEVAILKNLNPIVTDDFHIKFYLATEKDKLVYKSAIDYVNRVFMLFSLEEVIVTELSNFVESIDKKISQVKQKELEKPIFEETSFTKIKEEKPLRQPSRKAKDPLSRPITPLKDLPVDEIKMNEQKTLNGGEFSVTTSGRLIETEIVKFKSGVQAFRGVIFDGEDSLRIFKWIRRDLTDLNYYKNNCKIGTVVKVYGKLDYDKYSRDIVLQVEDSQIEGEADKTIFKDEAPIKRVELRAHSKMTDLDSILDVQQYVQMASEAGYQALAITDKENVHAFPTFYSECVKKRIKPILGLDAYYINDERIFITRNATPDLLDGLTYVVFDIETTGFSAKYDKIIEIGAVKYSKGGVIGTFSEFINPHQKLRDSIKQLTNISQEEVDNGGEARDVLKRFSDFISGSVLVAHNAEFDLKFIYQKFEEENLFTSELPSIDTFRLSQAILPKQKRFGLDELTKYFNVILDNHHRAIADATATLGVFKKLLEICQIEYKIISLDKMNTLITLDFILKFSHPQSLTLLVKNEIGKKNLYRLLTDSNTTYLGKNCYILKSEIKKHREGLLVGSGVSDGEIFTNLLEGRESEFDLLSSFYDYFEVMPPTSYSAFYRNDPEVDVVSLAKDAIKRLIELVATQNQNLAREQQKYVVAVGNIFHAYREDKKIRKIFINSKRLGGGLHKWFKLTDFPSEHFRATEEMLKEFTFLPEKLASEIVITNTQKIASMIAEFPLFPDRLLAPKDDFLKNRGIESFDKGIREKSYGRLHEIYGENVPKKIVDRLEKELTSIISNHYSSIYYISHLLVEKSMNEGYVVGSRGSVGSSYVAYLMGITEVNPLSPHYICPKCKRAYFKGDLKRESENNYFDEFQTGPDFPLVECPNCKVKMPAHGINIPFETFLGFKGDKVPDIDLNFSGEYQAEAHKFCRDMFGEKFTFRSGTIGTVKERTAFGYVKSYLEEKGYNLRKAEIDRISKILVESKRTTGQHPGGIVVIPNEYDILDVLPLQHPANDKTQPLITHFDYHQFESNLLKFDLLGHDDPTMIKFFSDYILKNPSEFSFHSFDQIPLNDSEVLKLFSSLSSIKLTKEDVNEEVGTTAIPEFGTDFVKQMLVEIRPRTFSDLLKVSGLSHGTNVWANNAQLLLSGNDKDFLGQKIPFKDLIGCRDDIMEFLLKKGLEDKDAFAIMESVRKNRGVSVQHELLLKKHDVPDWYISSCKKIEYMFPKAHACAYVIMALRIGWFKVYKPLLFYQAFLSLRAKEFEYDTMLLKPELIRKRISELEKIITDWKKATKPTKEKDILNTLKVVLELKCRGINIKNIELNRSKATEFVMEKETNSLIMPFIAVPSLGDVTAKTIEELRDRNGINSIQDLKTEGKVNSTVLKKLEDLGILKDLPKDNQLGIFELEEMENEN